MAIIVKGVRSSSATPQEKTVSAGTSNVVVTPDSGKLFSRVTVQPTPTEAITVTPTDSTQVVTPSSGKFFSQVTVGPNPTAVEFAEYSPVAVLGTYYQKTTETPTPMNIYSKTTTTVGGVSVIKAMVESFNPPRLISFTLGGTISQAEEGMTWREWCDSDYNTRGFYVDGNEIVMNNYVVIGTYPDEVISKNTNYQTEKFSRF